MSAEEISILIFSSTALFSLLGLGLVQFIRLYRQQQIIRKKREEQLQMEFQQTLLHTQLEIQEQTLQNISQEIHDNIGQVLSLTKLNLGTMDIDKPDQLQQKIEDSKKLVGKAIQDLRDLSKSLNTDYVSAMGLVEAINYELDMIRKSGAYTTDLQSKGLPVKLEAQKELIMFRIIQEVINNIIKHAKASTIHVQLTYTPESFSITVSDNGAGFDLTPIETEGNSKSGLGLRNMHKRAQLIGAQFSIASTIGKGTIVTLELPLFDSRITSA